MTCKCTQTHIMPFHHHPQNKVTCDQVPNKMHQKWHTPCPKPFSTPCSLTPTFPLPSPLIPSPIAKDDVKETRREKKGKRKRSHPFGIRGTQAVVRTTCQRRHHSAQNRTCLFMHQLSPFAFSVSGSCRSLTKQTIAPCVPFPVRHHVGLGGMP